MALTLSAVDKNHLLRLTISISIIFIVTIVPQSSFQSLTTVTTVSSTSTFIGLDNDTSQQDRRRTGSTSENQVQLLLLVNSSAYNTTTIPVELLRTNNINCLGEGAIYIHGVWTPREEAIEQAGRIDLPFILSQPVMKVLDRLDYLMLKQYCQGETLATLLTV